MWAILLPFVVIYGVVLGRKRAPQPSAGESEPVTEEQSDTRTPETVITDNIISHLEDVDKWWIYGNNDILSMKYSLKPYGEIVVVYQPAYMVIRGENAVRLRAAIAEWSVQKLLRA